ncbi:MAG: response regulator [Oscillospiraceae bacterium]|nr:response regulator [Oscillospiraceae bacterium]
MIAKPQLLSSVEGVAEQMPGGFFIYRADAGEELLYANKATLRIFGCDTLEEFRELTGYTFRGLVYPEDYADAEASIDAQIADADNANMDQVTYRIRRKDGSIRWVDDYGHYAELDGYGKVYYVFISDVTRRKGIEEENRRAAQVIDGLSVNYACIYLLNLDSGNMRAYHLKNDFFREISRKIGVLEGESANWHEAFAKYAELYIVPEDRELFLREIEESRIRKRLKNEESVSVSYRCQTPEGGVAYVSMSVNRTEGDGRNERVVIGFRDVTEDTLAFQRELAEKMKTDLDLEREKRTNEIRSQFLFNVSHDIRTPMNAIMGFTGLARRHKTEPERLDDCLNRVEESGKQLLELIDDLLDMSKLAYGSMELNTQPCNLREQITQTLNLFRAQAEEKRLILKERVDLPDKDVLADASRFRRVLGNLLSNAVKFTPTNGVVEVSARQKQVSESGYVRYEFTVSDTGVGMSEEFMRHMYESFAQENTSTKAGGKGSGLGLAITKSLLDIMGGSISVESRKDKGTVFTVNLPLKYADYKPEESVKVNETADYRANGPRRILLVEDIEINRMLAETILEEAGFQVDSVPDGCDAVDAIQNHPMWHYDLVLMDIQMPVMNGYEATRAIRAIRREDVKSLPIVALSANARDEDMRMSLESGMNNHVAKPFDVAQLISTINDHIESRERL